MFEFSNSAGHLITDHVADKGSNATFLEPLVLMKDQGSVRASLVVSGGSTPALVSRCGPTLLLFVWLVHSR